MLKRLRNGRRIHNYLKLAGCILAAVVYFTFLYRESLNAYEQNRDKPAGTTSKASSSAQERKIKHDAKWLRTLFQQQKDRQKLTAQTEAATVITRAPSTLNPIYDYSEEIHSATEKSLQQRRDHLEAVCKRYDLQAIYPPNPWEFFISPGHNLIWCNVFKAASTTWMYYFNILGGYEMSYLQRTRKQPLQLARKCFPRPKLYELLENLPTALSFLFVREPFERLVSAYRNKLEGGTNSYFKPLVERIIRQFRVKASATDAVRKHKGPTFEEFIRFLIQQHAQGRRFDEHWTPVYSFCTPCSVNFTVIGKLQTFQRDSEYIIRQAGLESLLLGKLPTHQQLHKIRNQKSPNIKTETLLEKYFSQIDQHTLDQLLEIYRLDFELFDYDYRWYYDIVQQSTESSSRSVAFFADIHKSANKSTTTGATTIANSSLQTTKLPTNPPGAT